MWDKQPSEHGVDVVQAIKQMNDGDVNLFFCMGGNFISATPDTEVTANGLNKVKLTVQVSTKLESFTLSNWKDSPNFALPR